MPRAVELLVKKLSVRYNLLLLLLLQAAAVKHCTGHR
jgi:hypothetical protein